MDLTELFLLVCMTTATGGQQGYAPPGFDLNYFPETAGPQQQPYGTPPLVVYAPSPQPTQAYVTPAYNLQPQPSYIPQPYGQQPQPYLPQPQPQPYQPATGDISSGPLPPYDTHQQPGPGYMSPGTGNQCFRKYPNCIIVNAQPFDRRTLVSVDECQTRCLSFQSGTYVCKSFVYDNVNQVCDLFGHTGNTSPARLIQFYGRDYFEPTGLCNNGSVLPTSPTGPQPTSATCPDGQVARFTRIQGTELQSTTGGSDQPATGATESQCIDACARGQTTDGRPISCKSFNFDSSTSQCFFSSNALQPTGSGVLQNNPNRNYYEKICLDSKSAAACPGVFDRVPQNVLVGFAETVTDAKTEQDCIAACINSQAIFGIKCTSSMYYYKESEQNCILNSENRKTQPALFAPESVDVVDYIDATCTTNNLAAERDSNSFSFDRGQILFTGNRQSLPTQSASSGDWTEWTKCDRTQEGRRIRFQYCGQANITDCPIESQWCNLSDTSRGLNLLETKKRFQDNVDSTCAMGQCCSYKGSCKVGQIQRPDGTVQWCMKPCATQ